MKKGIASKNNDFSKYKKEPSRKFIKAAENVANFVSSLPITDKQCKKLLGLIEAYVKIGNNDAFSHGVELVSEQAKHSTAKLAEIEKQMQALQKMRTGVK